MSVTYDIANTILNAARERLGDELPTLLVSRGNILDRTQAWTQQAFNTAWRKLQSKLAANPESGFQGLKVDTILAQFYANPNQDPASQQWIDVTGSFDGGGTQTAALPANLIEPLEVMERIYSASIPTDFFLMDKLTGTLPAVSKGYWNRNWQWRQDKLWLPGSIVPMDLRLLYSAFLADLVDSGSTPWFLATVPISRCLDPLSLFICAEYAAANGDADAATSFDQAGTAAAQLIGARDTQQATLVQNEAQARKAQRVTQ